MKSLGSGPTDQGGNKDYTALQQALTSTENFRTMLLNERVFVIVRDCSCVLVETKQFSK